jgi:hypothetical protein
LLTFFTVSVFLLGQCVGESLFQCNFFTPIVGSEASFHDTLDHSLKPLPLNVTLRRCLGISKDLQDDLKGKHNF